MYKITPVEDDMIIDRDDDERIGYRAKFWLVHADEEWMFKHPRKHSGEHWSEKIAYEVAKSLGIKCAVVELAKYQGTQGTISRCFRSEKNGRNNKEAFISGAEDLSGFFGDRYNEMLKREQKLYSVRSILSLIDKKESEGLDISKAKRQFAQYLLLDAVIGNTDRHHRNWGFLRGEGDADLRLAPTYDHASSMGRNYSNDNRKKFMSSEASFAEYLNHPHRNGKIYLVETDENPAPMVDVAEEFCAQCGMESINKIICIDRLEALAGDGIAEIIARIPADWMSDTAREFAIKIVRYNIIEVIFRRLMQISPKNML